MTTKTDHFADREIEMRDIIESALIDLLELAEPDDIAFVKGQVPALASELARRLGSLSTPER